MAIVPAGRFVFVALLCCFAGAFVLPVSIATAQEANEADDLIELSLDDLLNVEITSVSKKAEKKSGAAAAIYVLTEEDIRRSGATTIPDLLRLVPGLNVAQIDSNKWSVTARGSAGRFANKLLVLIDGRSIYTPFFSGVYWEANDVMLEDLERIEVIRGPGGSLWGANAVNGVINIVTKSAEDTQGGLLVVGGGTEEQGFGSFRYGGKVREIGHYRAYGKFFNRDSGGSFINDVPPPGGTTEPNDEWWMVQGGFRIDLDTSEKDEVTIQGDVYRNDSSMTHDLLFFTGEPIRRIESTSEYTGWNLMTRWNRELSDTSDIQLQFYYDSYITDDIVTKEHRSTIDLEFQHRIEVGEWNEIVWGAEYRLTTDDFDNTDFQSLDPDHATDHLFSVFFQDQMALTDTLKLTVGSKFEHNDYTGFEIQPSLRLAWTPNDRHTLWAAVSRAVRTPSRADHDLRLNFFTSANAPGSFVIIFGDDSFDSEELLAYELGYRVAPTNTLAFDLSAFYYQYSNLRIGEIGDTFTEGTAPDDYTVLPFTIVNGGDGQTYGFELSIDYRPVSWWSLRASYAFLEIELDTPQLGSAAEGDTPEQTFTLESRLNLPHDVDFDVIFRFVDELPDLSIEDYATVDLRLAWRPRDDLELAIVGRNLIEPEHAEFDPTIVFTGATEVQRSVYGKLTWRF